MFDHRKNGERNGERGSAYMVRGRGESAYMGERVMEETGGGGKHGEERGEGAWGKGAYMEREAVCRSMRPLKPLHLVSLLLVLGGGGDRKWWRGVG